MDSIRHLGFVLLTLSGYITNKKRRADAIVSHYYMDRKVNYCIINYSINMLKLWSRLAGVTNECPSLIGEL